MTKFLIFNRQKLPEFLLYVLCIFTIILVSACGDANYSSSCGTGIAFSVEWQGAPTIQRTKAASLDCDAAGVATVRVDVYDEDNSYLLGDSWPCSYHQGTLCDDILAGSNTRLVVSGLDSNGNVLYKGEKSGITVKAGETTNAGTIVVTPVNTPPAATITSPSDGSIYTEGDTITFSGTGEDTEDGTLTGDSLVWTSSIDDQIGTGTSLSRDDLSVGTHTITLTATDSDGATGSDSLTITVNSPPTATITSPSDGSTYTEGEFIIFTGTGEDTEDGTLTGDSLVWTSSIDDQIGTGTSLSRDDLSVGTHTITLTATDSGGASGSDSVTITVSHYTLTVVVYGQGAVTSSPSGINCGNDCYESYPGGTEVTLSASPVDGWLFNGWSGTCRGTGECVVTLNTDATLTTTFKLDPSAPGNHIISGEVTLDGSSLSDVTFSGKEASCDISDENGTYSCIVADGWSGTIIPAQTGYTFSPVSLSYSNVTSDLSAQDYTATSMAGTTITLDSYTLGVSLRSDGQYNLDGLSTWNSEPVSEENCPNYAQRRLQATVNLYVDPNHTNVLYIQITDVSTTSGARWSGWNSRNVTQTGIRMNLPDINALDLIGSQVEFSSNYANPGQVRLSDEEDEDLYNTPGYQLELFEDVIANSYDFDVCR